MLFTERQKMKYNDWLCFFKNKDNFFEFFVACGAVSGVNDGINTRLSDRKICPCCLTGLLNIEKSKKTTVGYVYRCNLRLCRHQLSLFFNTEIEGLEIEKFMIVLLNFVLNKKIADTVRDSGFGETFCFKIYSILRKKCAVASRNSNILLGGENVEIEIDETHLFKRKYNRGRILAFQAVWIFGFIERETKKIFITQVENRKAETLFKVVNDHVSLGTLLYSDGWRGYSKIKQFYNVLTVNHNANFVDPNNSSIHTNNIERLWRTLKTDIRGIGIENLADGLDCFNYKKNNLQDDVFTRMKKIINLFF